MMKVLKKEEEDSKGNAFPVERLVTCQETAGSGETFVAVARDPVTRLKTVTPGLGGQAAVAKGAMETKKCLTKNSLVPIARVRM